MISELNAKPISTAPANSEPIKDQTQILTKRQGEDQSHGSCFATLRFGRGARPPRYRPSLGPLGAAS